MTSSSRESRRFLATSKANARRLAHETIFWVALFIYLFVYFCRGNNSLRLYKRFNVPSQTPGPSPKLNPGRRSSKSKSSPNSQNLQMKSGSSGDQGFLRHSQCIYCFLLMPFRLSYAHHLYSITNLNFYFFSFIQMVSSVPCPSPISSFQQWYNPFPWKHRTFSNGNQNRVTKEGWLWRV